MHAIIRLTVLNIELHAQGRIYLLSWHRQNKFLGPPSLLIYNITTPANKNISESVETVTVFSIAISDVQLIKIECSSFFENRSINRLRRCGHITTSGVHYFSNNFNGLESQPPQDIVQMIYFKTSVMFPSWNLVCVEVISYVPHPKPSVANSKMSF